MTKSNLRKCSIAVTAALTGLVLLLPVTAYHVQAETTAQEAIADEGDEPETETSSESIVNPGEHEAKPQSDASPIQKPYE